jgi:hypothetical protein
MSKIEQKTVNFPMKICELLSNFWISLHDTSEELLPCILVAPVCHTHEDYEQRVDAQFVVDEFSLHLFIL